MEYAKLPNNRIRSIIVLYPLFLFIILTFSGGFDLTMRTVIIGVYILSAILNIMNLNFLIKKFDPVKKFFIELGINFKKRMVFLILGLFILLGLDSMINFLYQMIYIAIFISTDTYISHVGRVYILKNRKD